MGLGGKSPKPPKPAPRPAPAVTADDERVQSQQQMWFDRMRRRSGRQSTLLTRGSHGGSAAGKITLGE